MWLGIVIGNVWCTKKVSALTGQTFLLVAPEGHQGPALVCADQAGAGPGDRVLVTRGSGARVAAGESIPVDAAVVGIVDRVEQLEPGTKFLVLSPVIRGKKGEHQKVFEDARRGGYARVRVDGSLYELTEDISPDKNKKHHIFANCFEFFCYS